jgi:Big-like domain-containing protein
VPRPMRAAVTAAVAIALSACGSKTPTAPAITISSLRVAVAGNGSTTLAPGDTRQLVATAAQSDGTALDVTNLAAWQSSSPATATISSTGLLAAAAEGSVDVSATYKDARGTLHADVRLTCSISVTPTASAFTAFGGSAVVNVSVTSSACRWTARSDTSWLPFVFDAASPGSGSFTLPVPPNSTTSARTATVFVQSATGESATLTVTEDRPAGCSYVAQPEEIVFTASGGTGQFNVIATPGDCRWNTVNTLASLGVSITSGFGATGNGTVRYTVQAHVRPTDADGYLEIAGLSGLNPNGRHHVVILKR